jgi:hypothetical protein
MTNDQGSVFHFTPRYTVHVHVHWLEVQIHQVYECTGLAKILVTLAAGVPK